jgi:hypothetical protein
MHVLWLHMYTNMYIKRASRIEVDQRKILILVLNIVSEYVVLIMLA